MDRKTQDRNWNNLTEEEKNVYRDLYQKCLNHVKNDDGYSKGLYQGELITIVDIFGEDNLLTKATPKTWEGFVRHFHKDTDWNPKNEFCDLPMYGLSDALRNKLIAMAKIGKLIEVGYGGNVTKKEWEDFNCRKYVIKYCPQDERKFIASDYCMGEYEFIAFHNPKQLDEFMTYESNKELLKQYFAV